MTGTLTVRYLRPTPLHQKLIFHAELSRVEGRKIFADARVEAEGKAPLAVSADPNFRGDPARHNPEDLLVASLSACHMLWYLHLCAVNGVEVVDYVDSASGTMEETGGSNGHFTEVVLRPVVTITPDSDKDKAMAQHEPANKQCFITRSTSPSATRPAWSSRGASPYSAASAGSGGRQRSTGW
ncbi:MAG: OsmC family protein, partial [Proteobacteria bacterium]|nr:OsmC family protein [Pseudomonadota bacterium]